MSNLRLRGAAVALVGLVAAVTVAEAEPWQASNWDAVTSSSGLERRPAPIRNVVRAPDGALLGTRPAGPAIELWQSVNEGKDWTRMNNIASNAAVEFGDSTLYVLNSGEILAGYRERHPTLGWSVRVSRSINNGLTWTFAGTIHDWSAEFVGAPQFTQLSDGAVHAFYDSEVLASGGNQFIGVKLGTFDGGSGLWNWAQERRVNSQPANGNLVRDGLATIVNLGPDLDGLGDRLMVVTEGIGRQGGQDHNLIRAFQVQNGGATQSDWNNLLDSRVIYRSPTLDPSNHRYNAYAPHAIQVGDGPVVVAFSTDEFQGELGLPADLANTPPHLRHSEIKFIQTTTTFENWSAPTTLWGLDHPDFQGSNNSGDIFNYQIGLIELAPNDVLATLDLFNGKQIVFRPSPFGTGDYNQNGVIDAADYVVWRDTFGQTGMDLAADGDRNNQIDEGDYDLWRSQFGQTAPGAGSSVSTDAAAPEPATSVLVLVAATGIGLRSGHIVLRVPRIRERVRDAKNRPIFKFST